MPEIVMTDTIAARLAALQSAPFAELRENWRDLFGNDPPTTNRRFLQSRIAYRIQEVAFGGLQQSTLQRLRDLEDALVSTTRDRRRRRKRDKNRPVSGTKLIRHYKGEEHVVEVRGDNYIWRGRPYRSLTAIARAITGGHRSGQEFFGLVRSEKR